MWLLFFLMIACYAIGMPIFFALGIASTTTVLLSERIPLVVIPLQMVYGVSSFTLLAAPFFMLAGVLMNHSGISERLIDFAIAVIGRIRGGLAHANIMVSMIFAGMSGSSAADTSGIGGILIPAMQKRGYDKDFSVGVTVASSVIGIIIPPSIPMVFLAVIAGTSTGALFLGGIIPGILFGLALMGVTYLVAVRRNYPKMEAVPARQVFVAALRAIPPLLMPILILGGIFSGVATPTEAATIAVCYAMFLGLFVYKTLSLGRIYQACKEAGIWVSIPLLCLTTASMFGWLMSEAGASAKILHWIQGVTSNPLVILLLINVIFLVIGMFMDMLPAMLVFVPIFLPVATQIGIDPIFFGVMTIVNFSIGMITPPFGVCLFIGASLAKMTIPAVAKAASMFILAMAGVLVLLLLMPDLVLFLPKLILGD